MKFLYFNYLNVFKLQNSPAPRHVGVCSKIWSFPKFIKKTAFILFFLYVIIMFLISFHFLSFALRTLPRGVLDGRGGFRFFLWVLGLNNKNKKKTFNFYYCEPRRGEARNLVRYRDKHFFDTVYVCSTLSQKLMKIFNWNKLQKKRKILQVF